MMTRRTLATLLAVAVAAFALTSCAPRGGLDPEGHPPGTAARTLAVDGVERTYRVHVPADLTDDPALVVMLHGGVGSGRQAELAYGWNAESEARGFVVAYPDGLGRTWNAGDCCGSAARDDVDDLVFLTALVGELQEEFGIGADRTFGTGMSNGAMMAYRAACETELFAAIAPVAGTIVTTCDPPRGIPVLHVHGIEDTSVPVAGGPGDGPGRVDGLAVADAIDLFRSAGGCEAAVVVDEPPVTASTSACPDGASVVLITVAGAGHQWPGSAARDGADTPSTALDATAVIAEFFAL